ncbi:DUF836-domain-containing protein [Ascobolus immersus RN42]|uniref:Glutaredoxin-like protein n=1 Tax=Ascobolus immersus RN42 TaxID=1160509 RepID=A0A3N4HBS3_ASCIM|nr:DUF836-domain-containing protein [Ascobolus immersus RN42]
MSKPLPPPLLTLFTHPSCSLCHSAKAALAIAWEKRPFQYEEIDVYSKEAEKDGWDAYRLDVPVLHIQWKKGQGKRRVIMHKVEESEILKMIREVEAEAKAEESDGSSDGSISV